MQPFSKERRIILAIQAIKNNKNLSCRQAAKIYGIPEATMHHRMNGRASKPDSRNAHRKLINSKQDAIFQYIVDLDERVFPPWIASVEDMANLLLKKRSGGTCRTASGKKVYLSMKGA